MKKWILAAVISVALYTPAFANHDNNDQPATRSTYEALSLFGTVFDQIRRKHVQEQDENALIEAAIRAMLKYQERYDDKNSSYIPPAGFGDVNDSTRGQYFGIGAEVEWNEEKKGVRIVNPMEGSPAEAAGLMSGDIIIKIDGVSTGDSDLQKSIKKIKGPSGSNVIFEILRKDVEEPLIIVITRGQITQKVVRFRIIDNKIMYIQLRQFNQLGQREMEIAIEKMMAEAEKNNETLQGLIFDVRSNPGGLLRQAVSITDMFLDEGLIIETRPRNPEQGRKQFATEGQAIPANMPIVILINEFSASASEIVAGTLKDLNRATIVGVKSYGKGSVQTISRLPNGGGLRLTIAKYYTAGGTSPHGVGITPNIEVVIPEDYWRDIPISERRNYIDPQLQKAIDVINQSSLNSNSD